MLLNVVAKKRDASTDLLQRLHGNMKQHNVDFIGSDFNMSALSTVGDVFSVPEFSAPGNSFLWDLVRWKSSTVSALCSSSCLSAHTSGVWIHMAASSLTTQRWASDLVIKPLTFLCFSTFAPPTCLTPTASCAVSKRNKEGLSADITNTSVCGDDVLNCDVAHQSHVSAHLFPSLLIICESLGASCFASHRRSDVLLQVSVSVSFSRGWQGQGKVRDGTLKPCA